MVSDQLSRITKYHRGLKTVKARRAGLAQCSGKGEEMGGTNPYIDKAEVELPTTSYTITFIAPNKHETKVVVEPDKIPYGPTGLPGSVLDIAMGNGVDLEHVCGGVCACSTCHVIVKKGLETCNEGTDDEFDQLEEAPVTTLQSRLGCQCVPNGTTDVVIEIPAVNKNLAKEGH